MRDRTDWMDIVEDGDPEICESAFKAMQGIAAFPLRTRNWSSDHHLI